MNDEIVRSHLQGRNIANPERAEPFVAGVYPLLTDETCWFLAADFDKQCWQRDALAFLATCRERSVPAALERSRSGNGGARLDLFLGTGARIRGAQDSVPI